MSLISPISKRVSSGLLKMILFVLSFCVINSMLLFFICFERSFMLSNSTCSTGGKLFSSSHDSVRILPKSTIALIGGIEKTIAIKIRIENRVEV